MKILFLDFETTGLNAKKDKVWQAVFLRAWQGKNYIKLFDMIECVGLNCIRNIALPLKWADRLVVYNVLFEKKFIQAHGLTYSAEDYCAMRKAKDFCAIEKNGRIAYPKLQEAVDRLTVPSHLQALARQARVPALFHDALYDVLATVAVYARMEELRVIHDELRVKLADPVKKAIFKNIYGVKNLYEDNIIKE